MDEESIEEELERRTPLLVSASESEPSYIMEGLPAEVHVSQHDIHIPKVLLTGANIVNADTMMVGDMLIGDGKILAIQPEIKPTPDVEEVLDVRGMYILPGGIDPHTHFDFEFMGTKTIDDFFTGTRAAVRGGTTTIIDFIVPYKDESLAAAYDRYMKKAEGNAVCDFAFHMAITKWNESISKEMQNICMINKINSFKMFMAYKDTLMVNDSDLYRIFYRCKTLGALPMVHAENGLLIAEMAKRLIERGITGPEGHEISRPEEVEEEATNRACVIANQVGCPLYVVHVMSDSAANVIAKQRANGKRIYGEAIAAGLGSTGAPKGASFKEVAAHVMSPPIRRDPQNKRKLMQHLALDNLSCVGSDNCTFTTDQKEKLGKNCFTDIPNGVNGVEERMCVVYRFGIEEKILSYKDFVRITSTNAAKLFNLYPKKGCLAVGSDADIVVWNPCKITRMSSETHKSSTDFNIFEGVEAMGGPEYVIVRGLFCVRGDKFKVVKGFGRYAPTLPFSPEVYTKENADSD
ncbi:hypothetical protein O3M35_007885 [Rhynocoris fuscipes]|uniref:dihydropyrimidinase n=1 Tax=Rhynocoris fuscipes TaxID=488301 RepID=A0AAW1DCD1_9HEMI